MHILGAGSMGLLFTSYLAKAGHKVTLILKNDAKACILVHCISEGMQSTVTVEAATASEIPAMDTLLVFTKAQDVLKACRSVSHAITANTRIVLFSNGAGFHESVVNAFPQSVVYAAVTREAARRCAPFTVEHTGKGLTLLGAMDTQHPMFDLSLLASNLPVRLSDNIEKDIWRKLVINCCINPLTAIYNCPNGTIMQHMEEVKGILRECIAIAQALNIGAYLDNIERAVHEVLESTAKNSSSMREDIRNRRPSEIDSLTGYILQQAKITRTSAPFNNRIYQQIKLIESGFEAS